LFELVLMAARGVIHMTDARLPLGLQHHADDRHAGSVAAGAARTRLCNGLQRHFSAQRGLDHP
jgi:hypothetical protein